MNHPKLSLAALRKLTDRMPFNKSLGLRIARTHRDGVTIEIPVRDELRNIAGMLHGGVTATIVDAAVGIAIHHHFGGKRQSTTVEMKLNYFRPIVDGKVIARSRLLRIGQHLVVGNVEVKDVSGNLAGFAIVTYMLLDAAKIKQ